jgi:hypothetical protein
MSYCASGHGKDAQGDGPAASTPKPAPADLTAWAKQNGGKYPSDKVTTILRGHTKLVAHGSGHARLGSGILEDKTGRRAAIRS